MLRRLNVVVVAFLVLVAVVEMPVWRPIGPAGVPLGSLTYAPQSLADRLGRLPSELRLGVLNAWNPQVWGSWLELAVPAYRYGVDSRIELFPKSVWDDYDAIHAGDIGLLDRAGVSVVVTDHDVDATLEAALRASDRWATAFEGCDGDIWVHRSAFAGAVTTVREACP